MESVLRRKAKGQQKLLNSTLWSRDRPSLTNAMDPSYSLQVWTFRQRFYACVEMERMPEGNYFFIKAVNSSIYKSQNFAKYLHGLFMSRM